MDLISNLVIDRVLRVGFLSLTDGELLGMANQISDCKIDSTQENSEAKDAVGVTISYLARAKNVSISATSKLIDFGVAAMQWGTTRQISSSANTITGTVFDEHTITSAEATAGDYNLKHAPKGSAGVGLKYIYKLNSQGNANTKYTYGAAASASAFTYTAGATEITLPTGAFVAGDKVLAVYSYDADDADVAMSISNNADVFPESVKGLVECLFRDPCTDVVVYGYFITPKSKLDGNFGITLSTDGTHDFKLLGEANYCGSTGKELLQIFVPDYSV